MNEAAIKEKIRKVASDLSITFNEAWHRLIMERFLARLAKSNYKSSLILKGGSLLARYLKLDRETKDLDFVLSKIILEKESVKELFQKIGSQNIQDDFQFHLESVADLAHTHMKYPGFTVRFIAKYGRIKSTLDIDVGAGDLVESIENNLTLLKTSNGAIFEDAISLLVYPPETIFAEKLQTAVARGASNSRMKDYHDMIMILLTQGLLAKEKTKNALVATFAHRETKINTPMLQFNNQEIEQLQQYWNAYLRKTKSQTDIFSRPFGDIVELINENVLGILS